MSIAIVSAGAYLNIHLLFEQLWIVPDYSTLRIEHVVDIILENMSELAIDTMSLLVPHALHIDAASNVIDVEILDYGPHSERKYNWYLDDAPAFIDTRDEQFRVEYHDTARKMKLFVVARSFTVGLPSSLREAPLVAAKMSDLPATLLEIKSAAPINPGAIVALRLRMTIPKNTLGFDSIPVSIATPEHGVKHQFSWDISFQSSDLIRKTIKKRFRELLKKPESSGGTLVTSLREHFINTMRRAPDTVTRISEHFMAVVAPANIEVIPVSASPPVNLASNRTFASQQNGEDITSRATVWTMRSTSPQNRPNDLKTNIDRIIDYLLHINNRASQHDVITMTGNAGQPEVAGLLFQEMIDAGLIRRFSETNADVFVLNLQNKLDAVYLNGVRAVLRRFENVVNERVPLSDQAQRALYEEFVNCPTYQALLRIRWDRFPDGYIDQGHSAIEGLRRLETSQKLESKRNWKWTRIAIVIGTVSAILTAVSLVWQAITTFWNK